MTDISRHRDQLVGLYIGTAVRSVMPGMVKVRLLSDSPFDRAARVVAVIDVVVPNVQEVIDQIHSVADSVCSIEDIHLSGRLCFVTKDIDFSIPVLLFHVPRVYIERRLGYSPYVH